MERNHINGPISLSTSGNRASCSRSAVPPLQPNYSSRAVQEALEHLASVDLLELCSEAKVERCRATRDLRSCGRYVQNVLVSCGHASLCSECSQRCDLCPICRVPISKNSNRTRLRLYYECIEAGLISKKCDERFQEKEDGDNQLTADVQRLYALFDVAMENNLVSLICHYVTDVCMDETAVSSDPVIAFLLDEVVVKDWCKRTFQNILLELQAIYKLETEEMKTRLYILVKLSMHLGGLLDVLEVLESSFKGNLSAQLHDLQLLQESILKTKQHMEIMKWCIRHNFLENVKYRHANFATWRSAVRERKSTAIKRSWPDVVNQPEGSCMMTASLFIEDALENLEIEQGFVEEGGEIDLASLQEDLGSFFRAKLEGVVGCYPFESLRAAIDVLFLRGSSDLVVAKQAILLYYFFDRHWGMPDETWRHIVDDFAATFGVTRHALLESLVFYLLDDCTEEALKEACDLLPEISSPSTHPKIAQVLLEREVPDMALMVLRWSARDGSLKISLNEAVTAVRVRVECGLLTEAFMHQRTLCTKVKEKKWKDGLPEDASSELNGDFRTWEDWVEILVTELCCLCIKSKLVDRMIELPWNMDEEKYIHKCLLECAAHDPSTTIGSLLVVFYLQRYRYAEACRVNLKLQSMEQDFISNNSVSEEVVSRVRSTSNWRSGLVAKSIELLPQVEQQQAKAGNLLHGIYHISGEQVEMPAKSDLPMLQQAKSSSLLIPQHGDTSLLHPTDKMRTFKSSVLETPVQRGESITKPHNESSNYGSSSVLQERLFTNAGKGLNPQVSNYNNVKYDGIPTPGFPRVNSTFATPSRSIGKTSLDAHPNNHLFHGQHNQESQEMEQNGFTNQFFNTSPKVAANPLTAMSGGSCGFLNNSSRLSGKMVDSYRSDEGSWNGATEDDPMDFKLSGRETAGFTVDKENANGGPRWRSDESSDEEGGNNLERAVGVASHTTPKRGVRRSRFARR